MIPKFNNILQLIERFPDERSCHQYLAGQRWDGYMQCPYEGCGNDIAWAFSDGIRYKCSCCKKIYTAKTGTIFESSKISLKKWFVAIYLVMHKKGISSIQLSKDLGITQKSSWFLLQRIRTVLGNDKTENLEGTVLADETFVGGKNKNRHHDKKVKQSQGRAFKDKTPVLGLMQQQEYFIEERPHKVIPGDMVKDKVVTKQSKVVCFVVPDTSRNNIQPLVKQTVAQGSIFVSDEWKAYHGLNTTYDHYVVDHSRKQYVGEHGYTTNALEGFWTLCKRSIMGIYHKTSKKHLQKYFHEFAFRYNYRTLGVQEQIDLFISNINVRLKYKELIS